MLLVLLPACVCFLALDTAMSYVSSFCTALVSLHHHTFDPPCLCCNSTGVTSALPFRLCKDAAQTRTHTDTETAARQHSVDSAGLLVLWRAGHELTVDNCIPKL
jgi:hypothetical protein